jgi:hypothetical protein
MPDIADRRTLCAPGPSNIRTSNRVCDMAIDLAQLIRNEEVREALGFHCDLYFDADDDEPLWCTIDGAKEVTTLARDGSGGRFVTTKGSPRIVYASSEGAAGVIAADVQEFVLLLVARPYWRDLLKFSGGGRLEEMHRAVPVLEAAWRDEGPDNEYARKLLLEAIRMRPPTNQISALHRAAMSEAVIVHVEDGSPLEPLVGRYTVDDNPSLKAYLR